ncbi:uncharacterized protein SCHCODRAFT_02624498 [Schizophyllum commune H4-8]|uniref:uncharacterized protein n=1 Tax=Schizophyllum commune (strain H4-8 / FGSC 9210) TaxID=578458 RepID=UPI00215F2C4D|nr:uncharacterized protein SCHCODRAFT_02624498 [Schizophyllum commune H4-8]KAI5894377.1 hypothetical protein SCHCODRAFT_02624498 [Schizophyllum commune H4-8]
MAAVRALSPPQGFAVYLGGLCIVYSHLVSAHGPTSTPTAAPLVYSNPHVTFDRLSHPPATPFPPLQIPFPLAQIRRI